MKQQIRRSLMGLAAGLTLVGGNLASAAIVVDYNASASAGDLPVLAADSFSIDDSAALPVAGNSTIIANETTLPVIGRADAIGAAEITADRIRFAQQVVGRGVHSVTSTTVVTADIENTSGAAVNGSLGARIDAGIVAVADLFDLSLADEVGLMASMEVSITVDGDPLIGFSTSVSWDGSASFVGEEFKDLLNPEGASNDFFNTIGWEATDISLDLGLFNIGQSKEVVYTITTSSTSNTANCVEAVDCATGFASFGDPPNVEDYSYMLFSIVGGVPSVPEPGPLALLGIGLALLVTRRRRA